MSKRKISCCQAKLTMMLISNNVMNYNDTNDLQFHHIFFSSFDVTISDGPGSISFEILNFRILSALPRSILRRHHHSVKEKDSIIIEEESWNLFQRPLEIVNINRYGDGTIIPPNFP